MTKAHHSFNADEDISNFIEELTKKYNSKTEMFIDIFTKIKNKEIILGEPSIKEKQELAKLNNLNLNHSKMKSQIINLGADTELKKAIIQSYNQRGLPLPKQLKFVNDEIQKDYSKNPLEPDGLRCIECGIIHKCTMNNLEDRKKCREMYVDHIISKHKRLKLLLEEEVKLNEFIMELEIAS